MPYTQLKKLSASAIRHLAAMDPDEKIRVYTRQEPAAWTAAQERGYLTGSHGADSENDDFGFAYEWMRRQMAERIPDFSGDLPVWAWPRRQNERKWATSWYVKDRQHHVIHTRITALVPRRRVLLSCYEMWHAILNNWCITSSDEEYEAYEAKWPKYIAPGTNEEYQRDTEANWHKVFDVMDRRTGYMLENWGMIDHIQACVDRIYLDEVVDVRWNPLPQSDVE